MADHPNAALVRWALQTIRTDPDAVAEIWADEIAWHTLGLSEPLRTKQQLFAYLAEESPIEREWEVHDVVGNDEHVVALITDRATLDGRTLEYRTALVFHVRDGKLNARWELSDDTQRVVEFLAQAEKAEGASEPGA